MDPAEAEARFSRLYRENWADVLAYGLRRAPTPEDAADLAADTFLVAWRRLDAVPPGGRSRLWLFGVARHLLSNQRRSEARRSHLAERLREETLTVVQEEAAFDPESPTMNVLRLLNKKDREVLLLAGCEELEPAEIGEVLGISAATARTRLYRARKRFAEKLAARPSPPGRSNLNHELNLEEA
jgi:RNA polymerase sigma-70 factor (ECF subfamily)